VCAEQRNQGSRLKQTRLPAGSPHLQVPDATSASVAPASEVTSLLSGLRQLNRAYTRCEQAMCSCAQQLQVLSRQANWQASPARHLCCLRRTVLLLRQEFLPQGLRRSQQEAAAAAATAREAPARRVCMLVGLLAYCTARCTTLSPLLRVAGARDGSLQLQQQSLVAPRQQHQQPLHQECQATSSSLTPGGRPLALMALPCCSSTSWLLQTTPRGLQVA
jgi:hypothetical protein